MTFKTTSRGSDETEQLGFQIGSLLHGGEVIELAGDLGSGKTTLMHGVLSALGYTQDVPSPTFTLSRVYKVKNNLEVHHFDFYRLSGNDIVVEELEAVAGDKQVIVAAEWVGNVGNVLPQDRLRIALAQGQKPDDRRVTVEALGSGHAKIVEKLQ